MEEKQERVLLKQNGSAFWKSKTRACFCKVEQEHVFVYYPNWHACWKPWDQAWKGQYCLG